jgi:tripartite ATP-independent transporter DctP family solute receptor
MVISRRVFARLSTATLGAIAMPSLLRAQSFQARQYHVQPEESHLHIYLEKIWSAVREETNGRLSVKVYPRNNNVAAGEPELLKQVQEGGLEFFTLNGNILSQAHPAADIQGIPFAFSSSMQIAALNDGEFGGYLREELLSRGIQLIPFGAMENGFKQITAVEKPIEKAEDLRGFKMRVPNGKLFIAFYRALGADPQVVNFNRLYEALAKREVDGQENPLVIAEENKLYEVCKYLSLTSHQWAGFNMLASQKFWERLPEDIQETVIRNTRKYVPQQRAFVQSINTGAEAKLKARGMIVNKADIASFRSSLTERGFYKEWRASCGSKAWSLMEAQTGPVG